MSNNEDLDEIERVVDKAAKSDRDIIHKKQKLGINNKREGKGLKRKSCPICGSEIHKRKNGTCPSCGSKIFIVDGEYYSISQPQERLIVYTLSKTLSELLGVDVFTEESVKQYMPSSDDFSAIRLKNEAWSANKLLKECGNDLRYATKVVDIAHELFGVGRGYFSLYNIVSNPLFKSLLTKGRQRLYFDNLKATDEKMAVMNRRKKEHFFGNIYKNEELDIDDSE